MEDRSAKFPPVPVFTPLCPVALPHLHSLSITCRDSDGKACKRSDCLKDPSVPEKEEEEEDGCHRGRVQCTIGLTPSLAKSESDSSPMHHLRPPLVLSRIDGPSNQKRHSSVVRPTKVCGVEVEGEMTEVNDGKVCRGNDCLQDPSMQEREEEDDCGRGRVQSTAGLTPFLAKHARGSSNKTCSRVGAECEMTGRKEEKGSILTVTTQPPTAACQVVENIGKAFPGHGGSQSEVELEIAEAQNSAPPGKKWVIGLRVQSFKSKMASFTEVAASPVQHHEANDLSPSSTKLAFQLPTLCSLTDDIHKRHCSEGKPKDSISSLTMGFDKHTKISLENSMSPQRRGRDSQTYKQVLFRDKEESESALLRLHSPSFKTRLQLRSEQIESLANNLPPDSSRGRCQPSLCPGASGEQENKDFQSQCLHTEPTCLSGASSDNCKEKI
ncbi:uncharacterized protein LOC118784152 [Megalops cyprinoides]|uniref:uncharacterized protein LOC118784152 n=1 Tax=Megalops cyprinoides TaxID=118141 RepID=UPI001863E076|nr:uncharacterized protein LOC118784152 [Megalops cyprinoides]